MVAVSIPKPLRRAFAAAGLASLLGGCSTMTYSINSQPLMTSDLPTTGTVVMGGHAETPAVFNYLCTTPDCPETGTDPSTPGVHLTNTMFNQLQVFNKAVNQSIRPMTDKDQYGSEDMWTYAESGAGDCEDYALVKRRELIAQGWSPQNLLITIVGIPRQGQAPEGHALLSIRLDDGRLLALDNQTNEVKLLENTGYVVRSIQDPNDPRGWLKLQRTAQLGRLPARAF